MLFELPPPSVISLLIKQLCALFFIDDDEKEIIESSFPSVIYRLEYNFLRNDNKYYVKNGDAYFNPFHSGQWTIFLYYFSYYVSHCGLPKCKILADKIYYLNKVMNSCDLYHEVCLPDVFKLDHPVGSVMGRATYGNGFEFGQYSTVGNNNGIFPVIGENCRMCMNSAIIGNCHIGDNVIIGAGALVKDTDVPSNVIVFGQSPNLIIKQR